MRGFEITLKAELTGHTNTLDMGVSEREGQSYQQCSYSKQLYFCYSDLYCYHSILSLFELPYFTVCYQFLPT